MKEIFQKIKNKKTILFLSASLFISLAINVVFYFQSKFPIVTHNSLGGFEVVRWGDSSMADFVEVSGAIKFSDAKDDPSRLFEQVSFKIERNYRPPFNLKCVINETYVFDYSVGISWDTECEIIAYDFLNKTASIKSGKTFYGVNKSGVTWIDSRHQGYLINSYDASRVR
ncbi:MAG: hypothetical protein KF802_07570 [Bdellovibrionaceae bacterium]|nr:hypothetical protein [Pseudobdellovibrionaceae bacterium]MBX3032969.1 hypothetical protein [Pseudobdellovibrionaceae bacterium]